jgi:hypothetical protein
VGTFVFDGCTNLAVTWNYNPTITAANFKDYLKAVTIPANVTAIGQDAFFQCTRLTSLTIPSTVKTIGLRAFQYCSGLISLTIENGVTGIGESAFAACNGLTGVVIPNSVTSVGRVAFYQCTNLASITIGSGLTSIGDGAFYDCSKLTSVKFERAGTSFTTTGGNLASTFIDDSNSANLRTAYTNATTGGIGTYTRPNTTSTTWTKQP